MSIVIIGGNECMVRKYKSICEEHKCCAKIFPKLSCDMKCRIGNPDVMVLFTSTMSHEMVRCALNTAKRVGGVAVERSHSSSATALKNILAQYA